METPVFGNRFKYIIPYLQRLVNRESRRRRHGPAGHGAPRRPVLAECLCFWFFGKYYMAERRWDFERISLQNPYLFRGRRFVTAGAVRCRFRPGGDGPVFSGIRPGAESGRHGVQKPCFCFFRSDAGPFRGAGCEGGGDVPLLPAGSSDCAGRRQPHGLRQGDPVSAGAAAAVCRDPHNLRHRQRGHRVFHCITRGRQASDCG